MGKQDRANRAARQGRVGLSLCMIVKDEAWCLEECLTSVGGLVDEIVVVDTGSTDATPEIARRHGARLFHVPWRGDFAAARNEALARARGEWILVLDADEALDAAGRAAIPDLLADPAVVGYFLNIHSPSGPGSSFAAIINAYPRLFRNRPAIRFEGVIHEQIYPALQRAGGTVAYTDITIHHKGYAGTPKDAEKQHRNISLLERQVQGEPDFALGHFHLGEAYALANRPEEALASYARALGLPGLTVPFRGLIQQNRASAYLKLGDFEAAKSEAIEALRLDPRLSSPWLIRAVAAYRQGRVTEAEALVTEYMKPRSVLPGKGQAVIHQPNLACAHTLLGHCRFAEDQIEAAESLYRQARAEDPRYPPALVGLAKVAGHRGDREEARQSLEGALALDPTLEDAHRALGRIHHEAGRDAEALPYLERILASAPDDLEMLRRTADALRGTGRLAEALALHERIIAHPEASGADHLALACLRDQGGDQAGALQAARHAVARAQDEPRAHFLLGVLATKAGQYADGELALYRAACLAPDTPEIFQNLAVARYRQGDLAGAGQHLARARQLKPSDPDLARLEAAIRIKLATPSAA